MSEAVLKRPTSSETDDDLQKMQEEWQATRGKTTQKPSVEIHKMTKKRPKIGENLEKMPKIDEKSAENLEKLAENSNLAPKIAENSTQDHRAARFQIDLDTENPTVSGILFPVKELNPDFYWSTNLVEKFQIYSKDDGFPEPLDLSAYFAPKNGQKLLEVMPRGNKSFFAAEFDRIHGNLAENLDLQAEYQNLAENCENPDENGGSDDFQAENEKYLKSLDPEKIQEMKLEISERFDPKLLEFLKNRGNSAASKNEQKEEEQPKKISKFKASRQQKGAESIQKGAEPIPTKKEAELPEPPTKQVEEMMNELEVLEEWTNREDQEKYNRLATDAIQLDLTAKFSRNLASRQQKNAVKLFDNCKFRPEGSPLDPLLEQARSSIDQIKTLYLEEHTDGSTVTYEFGKGVNPILDNCWTLQPIRRVLDTVERQRQGHVTQDDVEIVRLALLWTLLLFSERKSAFFAFAQPNDFFVHLTEVYLIGSEILSDDVITECTARLMNQYVMTSAKNGKIALRMSGKVAELDAFMPFYENLLRNYEQYSMGCVGFAKAILIGAYLNAPVGDSIEYRFALWSPKRHTIRQMTVTTSSCRDLFEAIKQQISERETVIYEQHYVQYCSLLGAYVTAIRDDVITRDRNQLIFEIAAFEIGKFMEKQRNVDDGKKREFQLLVDIIRKSIGDKLNF